MERGIKYSIFAAILLLIVSCKKEDNNYRVAEKAKILEYLRNNNLNATETPTGLFYIIEKNGNDTIATLNSTVSYYYEAYLLNGTEFSKYTEDNFDDPIVIKVANVNTRGLKEGLQIIGEGGQIKLIIPSYLGYGNVEMPEVPPNSITIYNVYIVDVDNE